jgi:uncharacterized protein (TIGR03083 family)
MENSRYLDCLAADYAQLRAAAASVEHTAPVPSCPGWTMDDLAFHVAEVYLHKAVVMKTGEWPKQWPPPGVAEAPRLALLDRCYAQLTGIFGTLGPDAAVPTWFDPDQTVAFWIRRMAQETVIHRMDAELAAGLPVTAAQDDLAIDGVDEVLKRFLGYDDDAVAEMAGDRLAVEGGQDAIEVGAGGASWTIRPEPGKVTVTDGPARDPRARISGPPDPMLRWLWGRSGTEAAVQLTGDPAWAGYLRRMLVATTQ